MPADELPIVPEIVPALMICQIVPEPPLTASPLAVVVMLPALVIVSGLLVAAKVSGPVIALLIVRPPPLTLTVKVSVAAVELGPPAAAWVAVTVWLALLRGEVGVKLQALLETSAVPTCVPSIETVTVSPLTPPPEMTGSVVVVSVLPLAGLAIVGAAGAVGTLTVKGSVAAVELGPPGAACVAVTVWLALLSGLVGV